MLRSPSKVHAPPLSGGENSGNYIVENRRKNFCLYMNRIVKESGSKGYLHHSPLDTMDIRVHHQTAEVTGGVLMSTVGLPSLCVISFQYYITLPFFNPLYISL